MSNIGETVIQLFNDWFLKQHGLLPQQAIDRINELEATIERVRGLPRYDSYAQKMVVYPDGDWISFDELQAELDGKQEKDDV